MGRVNIEERCFGERRLMKFAKLMDWNRRTALGCLVDLWHESQDKLATKGTAAEIAEWCWAEDEIEGGHIVSSLLSAGYISHVGDDVFVIQGNAAQIEHHVSALDRAKKGGDATKRKWEALKASSLAESLPQASNKQASARPNSMQGNSMQGNSMQGNSMQGILSTATRGDLAVAREWLTFAEGEMPWKCGKPGMTEEAFADAIVKVRKATGLTEEGMAEVLAFIKGDKFWAKNAISPAGLLKKSDKNGDRKIDNILVRMRPEGDRELDALKAWAEGSP